MRIILAGIIGRYPWGGVAWCSLMYLLGLRKLGHEVYYFEDTCECNYDPELNAIATDPSYALKHIRRTLEPFGFGESWCYVGYDNTHYGLSKAKVKEICAGADLFLVLSGGCWAWREHYLKIPCKAFIDSDPAFTQLQLERARLDSTQNQADRLLVEFFATYDRLFTFGSNIGSERCPICVGEFCWMPTWQPVCTELWSPESCVLPSRRAWTTVMTWRIKSFAEIGGNKDEEFLKVLDLPRRAGGMELELATDGPRELLSEHGWGYVEAFGVSSDLWRYHRYISQSRGEFSVAKHTYVRTNSGWFSDRSICYLSCGRPVVVQETGFSAAIPTGKGLLSWGDAEQALEALECVEADYEAHSWAARELAVETFEDRRVLKALLERC